MRIIGSGSICALMLGMFLFGLTASAADPARVSQGLLALYDFSEGSGDTIRDRSGVGEPLNLTIDKSSGVRWGQGSLTVQSAVLIASPQPAKKIVDAVKKSNALTIEAWLTPASASQTGPARIVSLSADISQRNVTLGQDKDIFDVRLRATGTDTNGLPSTSSPKGSLQARAMHVVFTRDAAGNAVVYIDGKQVATKKVNGPFSNWDDKFRLILANELTKDRPWLGAIQLVAIYDRALSAQEVQQNFAAGKTQSVAAGKPPTQPVPSPAPSPAPQVAAARSFDTEVAPLLAKHCLECHDSTAKKGGLDLSRKDAAFAGGDSGKVIVPGKAAESLLWHSIESGEMPKKRSPLSPQDQAVLRQWIDGGANWTTNFIDPATYARSGPSGENWLRRLTVPEYIETVRSAVGVDIAEDARKILPPDLRADGFSNTAYNLNVDLGHVEAYAKLAEIIVTRLDAAAFSAQFTKKRKLDGDEMAELIANMGKWLLRGPLEPHEINTYRGIATTVASAGGDYKEAVSYIVEAMLQSPRFIYRIEPQHRGAVPRPVGPYELASRLSYILWGAPPDKELMRAADAGELADRSRVEAQVRRMLQDPRAIERSSQFIYEWLDLGRLDNLRPNSNRFPKWDPSIAVDMRDETLAFFKEVAWNQKRPLADLLNAQVTFATPRLAEHYGLKPSGTGLARYDLSSVAGRGGLLTQGSVLTIGGDDASMVTRGLFVLHDFLRGVVKDPPPCVDTTPVPTKPGLTQRAIAESRLANTSCSGCHAKFETLAFGLEKFDGLAAYHEQDVHGNKLREDGEILFPGDDKPIAFKSSAELMNLLAGSQRVRECITWKVTQFALGRPLVAADAPIVEKIHKSAQDGGGSYMSLITAIVMSDLVQTSQTERSK
jgi:hypothetical protein